MRSTPPDASRRRRGAGPKRARLTRASPSATRTPSPPSRHAGARRGSATSRARWRPPPRPSRGSPGGARGWHASPRNTGRRACAHAMRPASPGALREYLYPLGYWETVRAAAQAHGVDPLLVLAVIRQESHFEPEAVSSAGARGLMQLLPATARQVASADGAAPPA